MKKISIFSILTLFLVLVLTNACKKDEFTEEDAIKLINENTLMADSIANAVYFTVKVIDASADFSYKSASEAQAEAGLAGVTVTLQSPDNSATATTDASGAATFSNLRRGSFAVHVEATDYTAVDFVASTGSNGYYSVQVPVLATAGASMMTVTGTVRYETDLLNTSKELASGVTVLAAPDIDNFFNYPSGVSNVAYTGFTNTYTTDASGVYTATLPADRAGNLTYDISVPSFQANQSLMLNTLDGVDVTGAGNSAQSIATWFGTSMSSATAVPSVNPVYCVFGAPSHTFTAATLVAEIYDPQSFDQVYVTTSGKGYTNAVRFTKVAPTGGTDAVFEIITDDFGQRKVEYVNVITAGSGFTNTTLDLSHQQRAANFEVTAVAAGVITAIGPIAAGSDDGRGRFLTNDMNDFTVAVAGTGTNADVSIGSFGFTNEGYQINSISINNGGTGYTVGDKITVTLVAANITTATATGALTGSMVTNIIVTNPGDGYPANGSASVIFGSGTAAATANFDSYGKVSTVNVTNGGSNYTAVPTTTVNYDISNKTATADVFVQNGEVQSIFNLDAGRGYDVVPALTFYSQYDSGNPAVTVNATVTIDGSTPYGVTGVTVNTSGTGIKENMATANGAGVLNNLKSIPGETEYHDFYLGTGVRTVGQ